MTLCTHLLTVPRDQTLVFFFFSECFRLGGVFAFFLLRVCDEQYVAFVFGRAPPSEEEHESLMWHTYLEFLAKAVEGESVYHVNVILRRLCHEGTSRWRERWRKV